MESRPNRPEAIFSIACFNYDPTRFQRTQAHSLEFIDNVNRNPLCPLAELLVDPFPTFRHNPASGLDKTRFYTVETVPYGTDAAVVGHEDGNPFCLRHPHCLIARLVGDFAG
jgi:hypothetical protein